MSVAVQPSAYRGSELLVALFGALSVVAWTLVLLSLENAYHADAPAITAGDAVPVKVTPVLDTESPLLAGHGKRVRAKMPEMWDKKPPPRPSPKAASPKPAPEVSTKSDPDQAPQEQDDKPGDSNTDEKDPDDEEPGEEGAGGAAPNADPGAPDGEGGGPPSSGDGKADAGAGEGGDEEDPLRAYAFKQYRARVQGALSGGFSCDGIPEAVQKSCRPRVVFTISGLNVSGYSLASGCDPAVDAKAKAAAAAKVGSQLPPPPEKYPDFAGTSWGATFGCR